MAGRLTDLGSRPSFLDPLWYAGILFRRTVAIMGDATPASLAIGGSSLELSGVGWLLIPALLLLLWRRMYFEVKLILFTLPLSVVALLVYSGKGMTHYGIAHLIAFAICIDLLVRYLRSVREARSARRSAVSSRGADVQ